MVSASDRVHWFSHFTGVSLELPPGWALESEQPGRAAYAFADDPGEESSRPRLAIRIFPVPEDQPEAWLELDRALRESEERPVQVIAHTNRRIDGQPATVSILSHAQESGPPIVQYQVFVQVGGVVCSVTGITEPRRTQEIVPVFEAAARSIRFIPIGRGAADDSPA